MKINLSVILILVFSMAVFGQDQSSELHFKKIDKNYSWQTASNNQIDSFYFNLLPVATSQYLTHFRIKLSSQTVDLFSSDNIKYQGILTNKISEFKYLKTGNNDVVQKVENQIVFEKVPLNTIEAESVIRLLVLSGQLEIPSDERIPNWKTLINDCSSIHFQFKINGQYKSQHYFCPWCQNDSLGYKSIIIDNYDLVKTAFKLDSLYEAFTKKLPGGKTYLKGGGCSIIYKFTDKQIEEHAKSKPRRDYMKSVKDTVDKYINAKLNTQKNGLNNITCFYDYQLTIGTNGKLNEIEVSNYHKMKFENLLNLRDYLADKREMRKCKTKIKEIFKEIDLSFLNLKYELYRTLSFDKKRGFQLSDNTLY